jgi:hypothetical protein
MFRGLDVYVLLMCNILVPSRYKSAFLTVFVRIGLSIADIEKDKQPLNVIRAREKVNAAYICLAYNTRNTTTP